MGSQVAVFGMNDKLGLLSFPPDNQALSKPYSDATGALIDSEVRQLVDAAYTRTIGLIEDKRELVESLAQALLVKEVLQLEDLTKLLGERPFRHEELRNIDHLSRGCGAMPRTLPLGPINADSQV